MSGFAVAAVLLAAAALVSPSPRRRLPTTSRTPHAGRSAVPVIVAACPALAAAAVVNPGVAVAAVMVAIMVGLRRRRRRQRRSRRAEGEALAAALEVLSGELRVGAHPVRAFTIAAAESQDVVARALRAVAARGRLGSDVAAGLRAGGRVSAVPAYWTRIATCWELAAEHGLPISVLMRAAQRDIADRQRFAGRIDAGLAGARATASILAGLPLIGVVLGELIGAHPVRFLLGGGGWLLVGGAALVCAGVAWSDRILDRLGI